MTIDGVGVRNLRGNSWRSSPSNGLYLCFQDHGHPEYGGCILGFRCVYPEDSDLVKDARVLRGGSWFNYSPDRFRCANRNNNYPDYRSVNFGFHCVYPAITSGARENAST